MNAPPAVPDRDLHAFVDGELSDARRRQIAEWLAERPEQAARVAGWRSQNESIRRLFPAGSSFRPARPARAAAEPIRLPPPSAPAARPAPRSRATSVMVVAALAAVGAMVYAAREAATPTQTSVAPADGQGASRVARSGSVAAPLSPGQMARRVAAAWRAYAQDPTHAVETTAATHAFDGWLMSRAGLARAPTIAGARFIGARILPGAAANAAFFLYESSDRLRIVLVGELTPSAAALAAPSGATVEGDIAVRVWRAEGVAWAIAAPTPPARLETIAAAVAP